MTPDAAPLETPKSRLDEVKSTPQKGLGLAALRKSLSIFSEPPAMLSAVNVDADQNQQAPMEQDELRQRRLEKDTYESAISRWREEHTQQKKYGFDSALHDAPLGALMWKKCEWPTKPRAKQPDRRRTRSAANTVLFSNFYPLRSFLLLLS